MLKANVWLSKLPDTGTLTGFATVPTLTVPEPPSVRANSFPVT